MAKDAISSGSDPEEFSLSVDGSDEETSSRGSESGDDDKVRFYYSTTGDA